MTNEDPAKTFESESDEAYVQYHGVLANAMHNLRRAEQALEAERRSYNRVLDRELRIYQQTVADLKAKYGRTE